MDKASLEAKKAECENAILLLMKHGEGFDFFFVRDILEHTISSLEKRIEALDAK